MNPALISDKPINLGVLCNISNINNYINTVMRLPMLTHEQEMTYARRWRNEADDSAAEQLVLAHLKLVASIAREYLAYNLPQSDLIQEGNIGLMKAVKRFDPDRGVRLSSYAMQWIRAEMNEYIFKNWRLVKFATTKAHRTLFYNLRAKRDYFKPMTSAAIDEMAERLNVSRRDVMEMEARLAGVEFTLDCPVENDEGDDFASNDPILATTDSEPTRVIAVDAWREYLTTGLNTALDQLNPRERRILQARWLDVGETAPMTLKDLGAELGVSHERVRQIEVATMKKLKNLMQDYRELEAA